ncbi:MAG: hypothetical protein ACOCWO_01155 [Candidatus Muiribacteriaceae bacterium]
MEHGLRLVHFAVNGEDIRKSGIEKILLGLDGIEYVDYISEDNVVYISFDSDLISIDSILEIFRKNNINIK